MAATQDPASRAAEQAKFLRDAAALAAGARVGSLATAEDGQPYASLVTPAFGPDGAPLMLLSTLSIQLQKHANCCLLLTGQAAGENPQTTPRLSLSGRASPVDAALAAPAYLAIHPYAELYVGFSDFGYWRLHITAAHYIGGFAAAAQLDVAALQHAIIAAAAAPAVDAG
jgi:putative heme iron utilization protein